MNGCLVELPGTAPGSDPLITSAFMSIAPREGQGEYKRCGGGWEGGALRPPSIAAMRRGRRLQSRSGSSLTFSVIAKKAPTGNLFMKRDWIIFFFGSGSLYAVLSL